MGVVSVGTDAIGHGGVFRLDDVDLRHEVCDVYLAVVVYVGCGDMCYVARHGIDNSNYIFRIQYIVFVDVSDHPFLRPYRLDSSNNEEGKQ